MIEYYCFVVTDTADDGRVIFDEDGLNIHEVVSLVHYWAKRSIYYVITITPDYAVIKGDKKNG